MTQDAFALAALRPATSPLVAVAMVGAALAVGIYLVAVIDALVAAAVAGRSTTMRRQLALPFQRAARLLLQAPTTTEHPDAATSALASASLAALAAGGLVVVPFDRRLVVADVADGIVLFGAAMALVMVAVYLHGWSPNSAFPLIGGYRFVAQALSYEMPIALVLIGTALPAQSLSVAAIVDSQHSLWNVVRQPLGLPVYLIAVAGLAFWGPLATPDAADLAGGTTAESSGPPRLAWTMARAAVLVSASAMGAATFLGGWWGPLLPGPVWMGVKTLALSSVVILAGHLLARVRLERFVTVAWALLIPLALLDILEGGLLALVAR